MYKDFKMNEIFDNIGSTKLSCILLLRKETYTTTVSMFKLICLNEI